MQLEEFVNWHLKARGSIETWNTLAPIFRKDWEAAYLFWISRDKPPLDLSGKGYFGDYTAFKEFCISMGFMKKPSKVSVPGFKKPERVLN